jgi:Fe-S-cluster containining protein
MARPNPCLSCGVCCTLFRVSFYMGELDDVRPGGVPSALAEQVTPFLAAMKGTTSTPVRCVALEGDIGRAARCSIHPNRPSVCREFEASYENGTPNPRCDEARARYGLPALTPDDWIDPADRPPKAPPQAA